MRLRAFFAIFFLAAVMAVPQLADAAVRVHYFDCKECHYAGNSLTETATGNTCLKCHDKVSPDFVYPDGPPDALHDGHTDGRFEGGDASNHYGNNPAPDLETSHNWAAPTDTLPEAGAVPPTNIMFYGRYGASAGKITCSRCHLPHDTTDNPKLLTLGANSANAMCLACHRDFASATPADHGFLSHPLMADYDAAVGGNPDYKDVSTLPTYNSADPYANGVQLVGGGVSCLTCHNAHWTDSDSGTSDGPLAALNQGDGLLLRGNGTQFTVTVSGGDIEDGTYPSDTTFCNTCHNYESATHGGTSIGCMACHGGHEFNNGQPNYYMLNDPTNSYTSRPTTGAEKSTAWGGTQTGVIDGFCERCHGNIETEWNTVRDHTVSLGAEDCTTCHLDHSSGAFSEPIGCDGCHGSPPEVDAPGNPTAPGYVLNGYAWAPDGSNTGAQYDYADIGAYKDESATPHTSHSGTASNYRFQCKVCHNTHIDDFAGTHNKDNTSFQDVLEAGYTFASISDAPDASTPSYNDGAATGTCSSVYCHSNGGVNDGTGTRTYTYANPDWSDAGSGAKGDFGIGTGTECARCHGNTSTNMGSATHDAHLDAGYACNICHVNTATSNTDLVGALNSPPATHINQTLDIAFDTSSVLKSGGAAVSHGGTPYSDATAMTCSAVYCHSSGQSNAPDRNYQTISWTTAGPLTCTSCHDVPSASQTTAHAAHVNGSTSNVGRDLDCATCHDDTMDAGDNTALGTGGLAFHVNGVVNVNMNTAIDSGNCSNISCHSDGNYGGTMTYNNPAWTLADTTPGTLSDCVDCHGDGTVSYPNYDYGAAAGSEDANSHVAHVQTSGINCEECHQATSVSGTALDGTDKTQHVDQTIDVTFKQGGTWDGSTTNKTCSSTACHGTGTPQWGGAVNCGDCHAANNTLADSHSAHYNSSSVGSFDETNVSVTGDYQINCGVCHSLNQGTTHAGGFADTNYAAEVNFDGTVAEGTAVYNNGATFTNDPNGFDFSNATCASLYCHGDFGGNGNAATPEWNNAATGACGTCHDVDTSPTMDGGSHSKHVEVAEFTCDYCHGGTAVNAAGGIADKSLHVNQLLNWELDASKPQLTASSTYNSANAGTRAKADVGNAANYASCDTVYCHSNVQTVPPGGALTYATPTWGGAAPCGSCHKGDAAGVEQDTASHLVHTDFDQYGSRFACSACHDSAGSGTNTHANYEVNVNINASYDRGGAAYNGATLAPGDAYGNCLNLTCHSNGQAGDPLVLPAWNTSLDCAGCHDEAKAATTLSGAHEAHIYNAAGVGRDLGCEQCHNDTVSDNTTVTSYALHVNFAKDIKVAIDGTTCSNIQCHSDGNFGNLTYNNPAFATDTLECFDCHGDGVAKSHPTYASGGAGSVNSNTHVEHVETSAISCGECHAATSTAGTNLDGSDPTQHVDQTLDVVFAQTGSYNSGTLTCSTTYCHGSGSPVWGGAALDCDACHSASNALEDSHGAHYESATVATSINTSNDSVAGSYIFQCGNCHNGTTHAGGAVSAVQSAEVSLAGSGTYTADGTAAAASPDRGFAYTDGTCNTNDCHNDGTGGAPNTTPQWTVSLAADCTGCHDNNVAAAPNTMATGSHTTHLTTAYGSSKTCNTCHNATVDGTDRAISDKSVHVNQVVNVAILGSLDGGNTYAASSCDAVYCHSTGQSTSDGNSATPTYNTATWGGSEGCGTCHPVAEVSGLTSGSHGEHLGTTGVNGCSDCHVGANDAATIYDSATHVDQLITVNSAILYNAAGAPGNGYGTCSAASCHDDGTGNTAETPVWGTAGGCASCHASDMTTASHGDHLTTTISANTISCGNCHDGAVKDITAPTTHLDGDVDVYNSAAGDLGYPQDVAKGGAPYNTCSTTYCHGDTLKYSTEDMNDLVDNVDVSPTWGANLSGAGNGCDYCHGFPPVGDTGGGAQHPASASCVDCHFHVNATNDGFDDVTEHIDGIVQVDGGNDCSDCHAGGAYRDPDSGDHSVHTDADTVLAGKSLVGGDYGTGSWWYAVTYDVTGRPQMGCGQCHPDTIATHLNGTIQTDLDPAGETIAAPNAKLESQAGAAFNSGTGVCSNVYCHSDGNGSFADSPSWNVTAGDAGITCASCHGNSPTSNAHQSHEVGIHYEELYDDDGVGLMAPSPNELGATGGADSAHGNSATSTTITCYTCHSGTVEDSANADNTTCTSCHSDTDSIVTGNELARIAYNSAVHLNGAKDVTFADLSTFKSKAQLRDNLDDASIVDLVGKTLADIWSRISGYKATDGSSYDQFNAATLPAFAGGSCSSVACHNGETATWTDSGVDCMYCHTSLPR